MVGSKSIKPGGKLAAPDPTQSRISKADRKKSKKNLAEKIGCRHKHRIAPLVDR